MEVNKIAACIQIQHGMITARHIAEYEAWAKVMNELDRNGLVKLEPTKMVYELTKRGKQYVYDLTCVPLPKLKEKKRA